MDDGDDNVRLLSNKSTLGDVQPTSSRVRGCAFRIQVSYNFHMFVVFEIIVILCKTAPPTMPTAT